ncbi:hypothetical protein ABIC71_000918 [Herbaspirillum seropedicae]|uniref:prohead protease/major capsid protein fusion protein n=1 Tax=Herbaspirillum seropedicae TaxID=964 RepID=UPI0033999EFB
MPNVTRSSERQDVALVCRSQPISSVDSAARTAKVTWTAGAQVKRYDWWRDRAYIEELSQEPGAARMERLQSGSAPLLDTHSTWSLGAVLGVVDSATPPDEGAEATVRFSKRSEVEPIYQDVLDGIIANVSVGARIHRLEMIAPGVEGNEDWIYRAVDWEPIEISLVPIGADPGAVVRSDDGAVKHPPGFSCEVITVMPADAPAPAASTRTAAAVQPTMKGSTMPGAATSAALNNATVQQSATQQNPGAPSAPDQAAIQRAADEAVAAERARAAAIRVSVRASGLGDAENLIAGYIERGVAIDAVNSDLLERMAQRSAASSVQGQRIETVQDETVVRREAMTVAIAHRVAPGAVQLTDAARQYRGMSLRELSREGLEAVGISTRGMSPMELAGAALGLSQRGAHSTTDLPIIFGNVISRTMREAYQGAPRTFTTWARRGVLSDFRPVTRASFDAAVKFEKVSQNGEYKYGKLVDDGEVIQLATYGKIVAFTRQMIINDDLSALQRLPQFFGRAAADMESDTVYGILTGNPKMSDGKEVFHSAHGNLAATGGAISLDTLSAGRASMRKQKAPGGSLLNIAPRTLLVPAALETLAYQMTSPNYQPTQAGQLNPFAGTLQPVVEARLDDVSTTAWYLLADGSQIDTVEFAYLDGEEGLFIEQNIDFDVEGVKVKGRIDFAAKAIDFRGMHKNPGA